jgi:predicted nicotinamide N-methyase
MSTSLSYPPTSRLPKIQEIPDCSPSLLADTLTYLRGIYVPQVRGIHRINRLRIQGYSSCSTAYRKSLPSESGSLSSDPFERAFVIRWLTALVSCDNISDELVNDAASLLAACAGTASAGMLNRVYTFGQSNTCPDPNLLSITLTDNPLDNHDYASVGAQTWGGAYVLADLFADFPDELLPPPTSTTLRVLELGAGTGLVGLALTRLLHLRGQATHTVVTDFYPSVLENLRRNVTMNFPGHPQDCHNTGSPSSSVTVEFLNWEQLANTSDSVDGLEAAAALGAPFDVLIGADIIYEAEHARWIHGCVTRLLRHPRTDDAATGTGVAPRFHLLIPLRSTHLAEAHTIEQVFPFSDETDACSSPAPSFQLRIVAKDVITCSAYEDDLSEAVEYVYYQIGWC